MPDPKFSGFMPGPEVLEKLLGSTNTDNPAAFDTKGQYPAVSHPGIFRQYPEVIGSPTLARQVDRVLTAYPEVRGIGLNRIQAGPTEEFQREEDIAKEIGASLLGVYSPNSGNIVLNYELTKKPRDMFKVLIHEMTHSRGHDETTAQEAMKQIPGKLRIKD